MVLSEPTEEFHRRNTCTLVKETSAPNGAQSRSQINDNTTRNEKFISRTTSSTPIQLQLLRTQMQRRPIQTRKSCSLRMATFCHIHRTNSTWFPRITFNNANCNATNQWSNRQTLRTANPRTNGIRRIQKETRPRNCRNESNRRKI